MLTKPRIMASISKLHSMGVCSTGRTSQQVCHQVAPSRRNALVCMCVHSQGSSQQPPISSPGSNKPLIPMSAHLREHLLRPFTWRTRTETGRSIATSASGGGNGGAGIGSGGGGGGGGDGRGDDGEGNEEPKEVILNAEQVQAFCKEKGITLPQDMLQTATKYGLRLSMLNAYLVAQGGFLTGFLTRNMPYFRDRILADNMFLFKVGAEVVIDSGCATVAEVRKRGDEFWKEFEFYLSDLVVGLVLDVALVSLMAPAAVLGGVSKAAMTTGWLNKLLAKVPSAMFEANIPGVKQYSVGARAACLLVKFLEYSLAGITCGLIGQGVCNSMMMLKRHLHGEQEGDVPVPPLVKTALVWGLFMGVSSNIRYQIVFGLERIVDMTIARSVPQAAYLTTTAIRFVNNVIGGENFIDMARWAGVQ